MSKVNTLFTCSFLQFYSILISRLGQSWDELCEEGPPLTEITTLPPRPEDLQRKDVPHPKDETDIEALRACWAPKIRESFVDRLPEGSYFFNGICR